MYNDESSPHSPETPQVDSDLTSGDDDDDEEEDDSGHSDDAAGITRRTFRKQRRLQLLEELRRNAIHRSPVLSKMSPSFLFPKSKRYRPKQTSVDYKAHSDSDRHASFLKAKSLGIYRSIAERAMELGYFDSELGGYLNSKEYQMLIAYLKSLVSEWRRVSVYLRRLRHNSRQLIIKTDKALVEKALVIWMSITSKTTHRSLIWFTIRKKRAEIVRSIEKSRAFVPPKDYHITHSKVADIEVDALTE